jgi:hypothetical protein
LWSSSTRAMVGMVALQRESGRSITTPGPIGL